MCQRIWYSSARWETSDLPVCMSHIAGISKLHMGYSVDCMSTSTSLEKKLTNTVIDAGCALCHLVCEAESAYTASREWDELFDCPGLVNAALTQLAGLAHYMHKQHAAQQSGSSAVGASASRGQGDSSRSNSRGSRREHMETSSRNTNSNRGSKGSSSSSSSQAPCIIGAISFSQLLLHPYHENISVAGGKQAIAAHAAQLEQEITNSLFAPSGSSYKDCIQLTAVKYLTAAQEVLEKALCRGSGKAEPATAAAQASASVETAGAAAAGEKETGGAGVGGGGMGAGGRGGGNPAAAAEGSSGLLIVPVLQLLLELAALLCFNEMFPEGRLAAGLVLLVCTKHGGEELLPFYTASGPLLMQVLWLTAQHEHSQGDESSWHKIFEGFLAATTAGMAVIFHSTDAMC